MLFKNIFVEDSAIALIPAVKSIHLTVGPGRAESADDRLPNLFMESVCMCENNGGSCSSGGRERGATVGVACEFEGRG